MRCMIIDVGSNTVKYDVFSVKKGEYEIKSHASVSVRLITHIENGVLRKEGLEMLVGVLKDFLASSDAPGCQKVCAFATASFRRIRDPLPVKSEIKSETGLDLRVLSGEEEAMFSLRGMLSSAENAPCGVMLDMGGGSTELNFFCGGRSLWAYSCPFGALSLKERFASAGALDKEAEASLGRAVASEIPDRAAAYREQAKTAYLVGGTARACAKLAKAFLDKKSGEALSKEEFSFLKDIVCMPDREKERLIRTLCPDRYMLLPSGCAAFCGIFDKIGTEKILFCRGGIREGYLSEICGEGLIEKRG